MKLNHWLLLLGLIGLLASQGFSTGYFYCVTNQRPYHFDPNTKINYNFVSHNLIEGNLISIGDLRNDYKVTKEDIDGGNFKATRGTPTVYFVYPTEEKDLSTYQSLVQDIKNQCLQLVKAHNVKGEIFTEVRISESPLSGLTSYMQAGYPVVFINIPTKDGQQNIFRINNK